MPRSRRHRSSTRPTTPRDRVSRDPALARREREFARDLKIETLPDGYALTYNNTGSMGANFFVIVQRTIEGKTIKCSSAGEDNAHAQVALGKSLHK